MCIINSIFIVKVINLSIAVAPVCFGSLRYPVESEWINERQRQFLTVCVCVCVCHCRYFISTFMFYVLFRFLSVISFVNFVLLVDDTIWQVGLSRVSKTLSNSFFLQIILIFKREKEDTKFCPRFKDHRDDELIYLCITCISVCHRWSDQIWSGLYTII